MTSGHRWNTVGDEFVRLLVAEYQVEGRIHWPTVIGATACLCGETALMAHETRMPERGCVDSPRVATFIHDGDVKTRTIWGYSAAIAKQAYGIDTENLPTYRNVILQLGTQLRPSAFPALDVPLHLAPQDTPMNAGPRVRRTVHEIAIREGIQNSDSAFALATATMKMIGSAQNLGILDLTCLALQCYVAGSRFAPLVEAEANPATGRVTLSVPVEAAGQDEDEPQMPTAAAVAAALSGDTGFGRRR